MARLPITGGDSNTWGDILNSFLSVEHNSDGTLKSGASLASKADDGTVVHNSGTETIAGVKTFSASPIVPTPTTSTQAANKNYVDSASQTIMLRPEDYGAIGDGVADDTTAVRACFDAANTKKRMIGTYGDPGATVLLSGKYKLTTLSTPIDIMCNVRSDGAFFYTPSGYAGIAVRIGHTTSGSVMQNMEVIAPTVIGSSVVSPPLPVGGIGVQIRNLYSSSVTIGKVAYFETLIHAGGDNWGVAYNRIMFRTLTFGKVALSLTPINAGGWVNHNTFIAGSITGSTAWAGRRASGYRGVVLNGAGTSSITGNTFVGASFEGDVYEHVIEFNSAYQNQFYGCRHEQGIVAAAVTMTGDTVSATAHVMNVGDMVIFTGTAAPANISFDSPYYVVAVPDANSFKISLSRGGSAITFADAGTAVKYLRPQRINYINSTSNIIDLPMTPLTWIDQTFTGSSAGTAGNQIRYAQLSIQDSYGPATRPIMRVRNRNAGAPSAHNPIVAVYPYTSSPTENLDAWAVALSTHGMVWNSGQVVTTGSGSPEGTAIAPVGSLYIRSDGASRTTLYVKESGTSNTGWVAYGSGSSSPDVQTFTADGTWTKPAGATTVQVEMIGGGGGGGSGARRAAGILTTGGAGGGGGGIINYTFQASAVPSSVAISVGQAGTGGAAVSLDDTNGNAGNAGTDSTFGSLIRAWRGNGGGGGTSTGAASGAAGGAALYPGGGGASSSATGAAGGSSNANLTGGSPGGAAGGGITTGNVAGNGGIGGTTWASVAGGSGGAAGVVDSTTPGNGGSVTSGLPLAGGTGGGGAASVTTNAQAGGVGGIYGAGGSGGGASRNGVGSSGAGGNGAAGIVRVITYF